MSSEKEMFLKIIKLGGAKKADLIESFWVKYFWARSETLFLDEEMKISATQVEINTNKRKPKKNRKANLERYLRKRFTV